MRDERSREPLTHTRITQFDLTRPGSVHRWYPARALPRVILFNYVIPVIRTSYEHDPHNFSRADGCSRANPQTHYGIIPTRLNRAPLTTNYHKKMAFAHAICSSFIISLWTRLHFHHTSSIWHYRKREFPSPDEIPVCINRWSIIPFRLTWWIVDLCVYSKYYRIIRRHDYHISNEPP